MKIIVIVLSIMSFISCNKDQTVELSDQEKSDLSFLREEEKLARDVYMYSFSKYDQAIFDNISNSEQSHMDRVLTLLNKYRLPDPIANNEAGVFSNSELQELYDGLTSKSDSSLSKALGVGATIEDLDIKDINTFKSHTKNKDLIDVYDNLVCGSRNHMRSFVSQLGSYTPVYISQSEFEAIINSSKERCGK